MQLLPPHFFYLAPIRGVTDALFRRVFNAHFPGFDAAVAPFISPQRFTSLKPLMLADILPENNTTLPTVPQLLYNRADDFITLGRLLTDLGYSHLNWNLGCPAPQVANKGRGSGLLENPRKIVDILETVHSQLDTQISLKTRLGFRSAYDLDRLLPGLEGFPLKEIVVHPRIGKQLYRGKADHNAFDRCRDLTGHTLVYNGDIRTPADFFELSTRFGNIHRWMIGRGALADPLLLEKIAGKEPEHAEAAERIREFHDELYTRLEQRLHGPGHLLGRMKQIWAYLIGSFPGREKSLKKIHKARTTIGYLKEAAKIFSK
ncbi:MAG TPA: tRNA-dihydrouridine synthase family protein [Desulfopila sp.]|nr:tRNA-dihydrouridine synthase family protein [Desulfopila sp.]